MSTEEILAQIEQFETTFDTYSKKIQSNFSDFSSNLSLVWKKISVLKEENQKLTDTLRIQNSGLMELRTESEDFDTRIQNLNVSKDELATKITTSTNKLEVLNSDIKRPEFELENLSSQLIEMKSRISSRENEKTTLDQKKVENIQREENLKKEYALKTGEIEKKLEALKKKHFFTSFIMENSDQDNFEVDIVATVMEKGTCNLNDLKKQLNVTPIMAVRTIRQLAVKEIINLDEDTNEITMH